MWEVPHCDTQDDIKSNSGVLLNNTESHTKIAFPVADTVAWLENSNFFKELPIREDGPMSSSGVNPDSSKIS